MIQGLLRQLGIALWLFPKTFCSRAPCDFVNEPRFLTSFLTCI